MGLVDKYLEEKDGQEQTPLFKALYKKNELAVKLLLSKNCDTTAKDGLGQTPKEFNMRFYDDVAPTFLAAYDKFEIKDIIENARDFDEIKERMSKNYVWISSIIDFYYKKSAKKVSTIVFFSLSIILFLTHFYFSTCPKGAGLLDLGTLSLLFQTFLGVSIFLFFLFLRVDPGYMVKRNLDDEDNIIKKILGQIDDRQFHKLVPENEICFDCLLKKPKHMDHCEECNQCVEGF
jgi:hypothetical protein